MISRTVRTLLISGPIPETLHAEPGTRNPEPETPTHPHQRLVSLRNSLTELPSLKLGRIHEP